jgi:hypothetical protein
MAITCEKVQQLTLFLENRPGILADLCAHLADRGVNIRAITTLESTHTGTVRLVVDQPEATARILDEAGVAHSSSHCLALQMPNHPGGFATVAHTLSVAGINIDFIYASSTANATAALGIFGVSDLDRALELDW